MVETEIKLKELSWVKLEAELSDISIVTSDNPRTEDPLQIINDVVKGIEKQDFEIIENRTVSYKKSN